MRLEYDIKILQIMKYSLKQLGIINNCDGIQIDFLLEIKKKIPKYLLTKTISRTHIKSTNDAFLILIQNVLNFFQVGNLIQIYTGIRIDNIKKVIHGL